MGQVGLLHQSQRQEFQGPANGALLGTPQHRGHAGEPHGHDAVRAGDPQGNPEQAGHEMEMLHGAQVGHANPCSAQLRDLGRPLGLDLLVADPSREIPRHEFAVAGKEPAVRLHQGRHLERHERGRPLHDHQMNAGIEIGMGRRVPGGPLERAPGREEAGARQDPALEGVDHAVRDGEREAEIVGIDDETPARGGAGQRDSHARRRVGKRGVDIKRNGPEPGRLRAVGIALDQDATD